MKSRWLAKGTSAVAMIAIMGLRRYARLLRMQGCRAYSQPSTPSSSITRNWLDSWRNRCRWLKTSSPRFPT